MTTPNYSTYYHYFSPVPGRMPWNNTVSSFQSAVTPRSCFVVGATGEVGKALVKQLLCSSAFERVVVLVRRPLNYTGPNKDILEEAIVEDFDGLETDGNAEKDNFRKVDYDYIMTVGRLARQSGCRWFGLVSSAGADSSSSMLYTRTKGEAERDLTALEFPHLFIYRPGLLQCDRVESRPTERVARFFAPVMNMLSGGRAAIPVETVAKAMVLDAMETAIADTRNEPSVAVKIISNQAMVDTIKISEVS